VVSEILPAPPVGNDYISGLAYLPPDRILLSNALNQLWVIDFAGNIVLGPVPGGQADASLEGLTSLPDGIILATDYVQGRIFALDALLQPLSQLDRFYDIGVGLSVPTGIAWDSDQGGYVVNAMNPATVISRALYRVPRGLDSYLPFADPALDNRPRIARITYSPAEQRVVVAHRNLPPALLFYDGGDAGRRARVRGRGPSLGRELRSSG
jgi:DNA-binding beta-propeller fold protein YncE